MNGWDYYRTLFKIGDQYYSADFVVRKDPNRNVIYDLEKINEADISQMPLPGLEARGVYPENKSTSVTDNIPLTKHNSNGVITDKVHERFQLNEPIEETKDLIAVRNVDQSNLASMLELEGLPSPSIAVTKADIGHTSFGDVTFIFGKNTIDPQYDRRNQVWDADAWTPLYPGIEYEYDRDTIQNAYNVIQSVSDVIPEDYVNKARATINNIEFSNTSLKDIKELIYNEKGMQTGEVKDESSISSYGVYQTIYKEEKGINPGDAAKALLRVSPEQKINISSAGDINCLSCYFVKVTDKATGLSGRYWISSDIHTWQNGIYTMELELVFDVLMTEAEAEEKK